MKCSIFWKRLLRLPRLLLIIWLFMLNQVVFAQNNGYWDDRFGAYNFDYPDYENIFLASVNAIALTGTEGIFIGGNDLYLNSNWRSVLKWSGNGWSPLGRGKMSAVYALQVVNNDLYVGGAFTKVDSIIPANRIAKYNLVTQSWSALETDGFNGINHQPDGYNRYVYAIAVYENNLYVGGNFTTAGAVKANNIAQWDIATNTWTALGDGVNGTVYAIAVKNGEVYVGGEFNSAGGVPANNIAKWNGREWSVLGEGVNDTVRAMVRALTICGEDLYVGGGFTTAGEINLRNIAKWNIVNQTWEPVGDGVSGGVSALASDGRVVYVGGGFGYADEMYVGNIVKWNPAKSCWSRVGGNGRGDFGSGINGPVHSILIRGNNVYVGGNFTQTGDGKPSQVFAIWHEPASPSPHAPAWSRVPDVTFPEDDSTKLELYQYVTDTEHDLRGGLNFSATVINPPAAANSNDLQIQFEKIVMGPTFRKVYTTFTSTKNASGIYTVVFTVTDACGASASDTIQVTVTPVNNAPVIATLPTLTFNEDDSLLYSIRNWFDYVTDADEADSILSFKVLSAKSIKAIRRGSSYLFTAPVNWNGTNTLKLIVTDHGQLADTAALVIKVNPINDAPKITGLPDSLSFKKGASAQLKIWNFVEDVETPDSLLAYGFSVSTTSIKLNFNPTTGMLVLTAPQFSGNAKLFVNISDGKASARDTIGVRVELPTSVASSNEQIPTEFVLMQNYPNPFNPTTLIRFGLPHEAEVKIEVLNLSGQHIATLLNERRSAGYHNVEFNAQNLASGVYFYRLTAEQFTAMRKLLLVQ